MIDDRRLICLKCVATDLLEGDVLVLELDHVLDLLLLVLVAQQAGVGVGQAVQLVLVHAVLALQRSPLGRKAVQLLLERDRQENTGTRTRTTGMSHGLK